MPSSLAEYSTHVREEEMTERSDSTRPGWIFVLMVVTLGATFLEVVINWAIAPMNGNWLLMAAKACAYSVCLPFVGGRHEFFNASLRNDGTRP
jgi:hypothetical protein